MKAQGWPHHTQVKGNVHTSGRQARAIKDRLKTDHLDKLSTRK